MSQCKAVLALLLILSSWGFGEAQQKSLEPLNVSYSSVSELRAPMWIASDAGLFEKHGLSVKSIYIYGTATITALLAGDVPLAVASAQAGVAAAAQGAPLVIVGAAAYIPYQLVAHPSITSFHQL